MTFTEFSLKAIGKFKLMRRIFQALCRYCVGKPGLRKKLNSFYNRLDHNERIIFHYLFATIFKNRVAPSINDVWNVKFINTNIILPLQTETLWLDWNLAVSILGHDLEIKSFYEKLINSSQTPINFFDVGANYGTHSLLFLSQGMNAITFEPNPECKPIFQRLLQLNLLKGQIENVAIGEKKEKAELVFPKNDTWNGSLQENYQKELSDCKDTHRIPVEVISLDEYVLSKKIKPDIIKIDTEGFELNVIKGAKKILNESQPIIVFETNKSQERDALFTIFNDIGYQVYDIGSFFSRRLKLDKEGFVTSMQVNFVALKESNL